MALSTLALVKAGLRQEVGWMKNWSSTNNTTAYTAALFTAGQPDAWTAPTPGVAGQTMTGPNASFVQCPNAASGETKLARAAFKNTQGASSVGGFWLCDLLWINSGLSVTLTTAQTVNSVTLPARDNNGATAGVGVQAGLLITATAGAGTPTLTLGYTNQAGTAGKTATNPIAVLSAATAGLMFPIGLAAGDTGVQSIQTLTLSATMTSGSIALIMYRPILFVPALPLVGNMDAEVVEDINTLSLAAIKDGHCLFAMAKQSGNANPIFTSNFTFAQG